MVVTVVVVSRWAGGQCSLFDMACRKRVSEAVKAGRAQLKNVKDKNDVKELAAAIGEDPDEIQAVIDKLKGKTK